MALSIFQQIIGIDTAIYYAPTIFQFAGATSDTAAMRSTVIVGLVNFGMTIVTVIIVDRFGRRKLLFGGLVGMIVGLVVSLTFPIAIKDIGKVATFFMFAGICVLAAIFTLAFVPETKGRSLVQIEAYRRRRS